MKHVTAKFDEMVMFCLKPLTKPEWVVAFNESHFISQRKGETLWVFDPDLDREPTPGERQTMSSTTSVTDAVHFENFCTAFEEVVDAANPNFLDLLLVSDAKHRPNHVTFLKHIKKTYGRRDK